MSSTVDCMTSPPNYTAPSKERLHVALCYKNFAASHPGVSHIGLGVASLNNQKVLRAHGIHCDVWPLTQHEDLLQRLAALPAPPTHVIVAAPWIPSAALRELANRYPDTRFVVTSHSNVGFLQADPGGVRLLREGLELQRGLPNFAVAGNSARFVGWLERTEGQEIACLPNLYDLSDAFTRSDRPPWQGTLLRIGCFGAQRPLKNVLTAAAAALEMAATLRTDLEFWVSAGRPEGGNRMISAVRELLGGRKGVQLREQGWESWPAFRRTARAMDVLLHPSYTESFMIVVADGIAEGVPSVVGEAVDWVPGDWQANVDDAGDIAQVGCKLLAPHAARAGRRALAEHVERGVATWLMFLLRRG